MIAVIVGLSGCGGPAPGDQTPVGAGATAAGARVASPPGEASGDGAAGPMQPVRLGEMAADRSDPAPERRNPFRFGVAEADAPDPTVPEDGGAAPDEDDAEEGATLELPPPGPTPTAGAGRVPLSFLGFVEGLGSVGRIVVLTDGEYVFHGREGDIIDGRYRIVGTGLESVDVQPIDGSAVETLRLPDGS